MFCRKLLVLFDLQINDHGLPEQAGESSLTSPQADIHTPPLEDIQITDVYYEDMVNNPSLETTKSAATVPAAAVIPGRICSEGDYLIHILALYICLHNKSHSINRYVFWRAVLQSIGK